MDGHRVLIYDESPCCLSRIKRTETVDLVIRRDGRKLELEDVPMALAIYEDNRVTWERYGLNFPWGEPVSSAARQHAFRGTSLDFVRMVWFGLEDLFSGQQGSRKCPAPSAS